MKAIKVFALSISMALSGNALMAAESVALIIANKDYKSLRDVNEAFAAFTVSKSLREAGFEVRTLRDFDRDDLATGAAAIQSALGEAERVVIFLAGHFANSRSDSWLLATDARRPGGLDVSMNGLSVNALMDLMADKAGSAAIFVGRHSSAQLIGPGLEYGYVPENIPQGVTVFSGPTVALTNLLRDELLTEGATTRQVADAAPNSVSVHGFVSQTVAFIPKVDNAIAVAPADTEFADWSRARLAGTAIALENFLNLHPTGLFAQQARNLLAELTKSPEDLARETEEALALSRDARREIQRNLTLLGFDTRGVDGLLGRGSRAALKRWQESNGFAGSGYLSGNQISALQQAASVRARELEGQARIRREEEERQDAAFWSDSVRGQGEVGMRAYLKRYPDGIYSEIARERLDAFDEERRRTAAISEGGDWDTAIVTNTIAGFEEFLDLHPEGVFAESAQEKLAALKQEETSSADTDQARAEEKSVMNNAIARSLVERRLSQLGFDTGKVDGKIDENTRRAIRQFQKAAGFPVTGYVNKQTIVRLLVGNGG